MSDDQLIYKKIDTNTFDCLKNKLKEAGFSSPVESQGVISGFGVTLEYKWDESAETLMVKIAEKPFLVTTGFITEKMNEFIQACGGEIEQ